MRLACDVWRVPPRRRQRKQKHNHEDAELTLAALALAAMTSFAAEDHKQTKECLACCKSADKCDACCKDKGKECGKECCKAKK